MGVIVSTGWLWYKSASIKWLQFVFLMSDRRSVARLDDCMATKRDSIRSSRPLHRLSRIIFSRCDKKFSSTENALCSARRRCRGWAKYSNNIISSDRQTTSTLAATTRKTTRQRQQTIRLVMSRNKQEAELWLKWPFVMTFLIRSSSYVLASALPCNARCSSSGCLPPQSF